MQATNILMLIFFCLNFKVMGQSKWSLVKSKDGIEIYTRSVPNKPFKETQAVSTIDGTNLHTIFAVFRDVKNAKKWTFRLYDSYRIQEKNVTSYSNYFEAEVPWPLTNRDVIYDVEVTQDSVDKTLTISSKSNPSLIPEKKDKVRIKNSFGIWTFTPIANGKIIAKAHLYADPVGFPAWVVNIFVVDAPFHTMQGLKKMLKKDEYQSKKFNFIIE